jgi:hypothetical protein
MRDVNFPLRGPGFLEFRRPLTRQTFDRETSKSTKTTTVLASPRLLGTWLSLDRSFSHDSAIRHISGPRLPDDTRSRGIRPSWTCSSVSDCV